jgi:hypothetical protein
MLWRRRLAAPAAATLAVPRATRLAT